jgi:integration host factor subunit alpha
MSDKTLTRMDLSEAVFREVGLSRNESANLVESVLAHMSDALAHGETVKISSFGTFSVRAKTARVGRSVRARC